MTDYYLICPPVSPYSTQEEIQIWIKELEALPQTREVKSALKEAEGMLEFAKKRDRQLG